MYADVLQHIILYGGAFEKFVAWYRKQHT